MIRPPDKLDCIEIRGRLRGGNTTPLLAVGMDAEQRPHTIVLKLRAPEGKLGSDHFGGISLACELTCSMLARLLELGVPDYHIVEIEPAITEAQHDRALRELLRRNIGLNFGCAYLPEAAPWSPRRSIRTEDVFNAIEDVFAFDALVINNDRQREKPNLLATPAVVMIDHSLAIPVHIWPEERHHVTLPDGELRKHCAFDSLHGNECGFDRVTGRWTERVDAVALDEMRRWLPQSWERVAGDVEKIYRFLRARSTHVLSIQDGLRRVTR